MAFELGLQGCLGGFWMDKEMKGFTPSMNHIIKGLSWRSITVPRGGQIVHCSWSTAPWQASKAPIWEAWFGSECEGPEGHSQESDFIFRCWEFSMSFLCRSDFKITSWFFLTCLAAILSWCCHRLPCSIVGNHLRVCPLSRVLSISDKPALSF